MITLTDLQKKFILLSAHESPVWRISEHSSFPSIKIKQNVRDDFCVDHIGVSYKTLQNYASGSLSENKIQDIAEKFSDLTGIHISNNDFMILSTREFSHKIGYSYILSQKIIDRYIYSQHLFSSFFHHENDSALDTIQRQEGFYRFYRYDKNENFTGLIIGTLNIRYPLQIVINKTVKNMVRVKLNLPRYYHGNKDPNVYYQYDGFISTRDAYNNSHWILEQRRKESSDAIFMISDGGAFIKSNPASQAQYYIISANTLTRDQSPIPRGAAQKVLLIKDNTGCINPMFNESQVPTETRLTVSDITLLKSSVRDKIKSKLGDRWESYVEFWKSLYEFDKSSQKFMRESMKIIPEDEFTELNDEQKLAVQLLSESNYGD